MKDLSQEQQNKMDQWSLEQKARVLAAVAPRVAEEGYRMALKDSSSYDDMRAERAANFAAKFAHEAIELLKALDK